MIRPPPREAGSKGRAGWPAVVTAGAIVRSPGITKRRSRRPKAGCGYLALDHGRVGPLSRWAHERIESGHASGVACPTLKDSDDLDHDQVSVCAECTG